MAVNISTIKTSQFIDRWAYFPGAIALSLFLLLIFGSPLATTLVDKTVVVTKEEPELVDTITLPASKLGALRIDVKPSFPNNHWVVYEIQLVDKNSQVIASAMDEAWKESGTWREGRESGTWSESDLLGGLDLRSPEAEELDIIIEVLESGQASGKSADLNVYFHVRAKNGVINSSNLWWGFFYSLALAIMALLATTVSGQKALSEKIRDSDPQGRATVGGENRLVRVKIKTELDEDTPNVVQVDLSIDNVYGEQIYKHTDLVNVALSKNDSGRITGGKASLESFFILESRNLYRFKVNIEPDAPVDWTSIVVRDGAKTLMGIDAVKIIPIPLSQPQQHFTME